MRLKIWIDRMDVEAFLGVVLLSSMNLECRFVFRDFVATTHGLQLTRREAIGVISRLRTQLT